LDVQKEEERVREREIKEEEEGKDPPDLTL
jgi:hypothetical protein